LELLSFDSLVVFYLFKLLNLIVRYISISTQ